MMFILLPNSHTHLVAKADFSGSESALGSQVYHIQLAKKNSIFNNGYVPTKKRNTIHCIWVYSDHSKEEMVFFFFFWQKGVTLSRLAVSWMYEIDNFSTTTLKMHAGGLSEK